LRISSALATPIITITGYDRVFGVRSGIVRNAGYAKKEMVHASRSENGHRDAVIRNFPVIGEAIRNLPDELRERYPDTDRRKIAGKIIKPV